MEEKSSIKFKLSLLVIHLLYLFALCNFLRWTITVMVSASETVGKGDELCIRVCAFVHLVPMYNKGFLCIFEY